MTFLTEKDFLKFEIHDTLNKKLWDDMRLKSDVRKQLLKIANAFHKYMNLNAKIKDVIITGSSSNYNYSSEYSDIDLHLLYDFDEILNEEEISSVEELVREYMLTKKSNWNDKFDIKINGLEVEVYPQDINDEHKASGQFSLVKNEWNVKPSKSIPEFDSKSAEVKAADLQNLIEKSIKNTDSVEKLEKIADKIKKLRQSGLDSPKGEFSTENLAFKILRRNGSMEKLFNQIDKVRQQDLSL